jgi:formylmethanofuran dehydrogenase subunit C
VKPLVLRLEARPDQRLDLSPLTPDRLAGKTAAEISAIELQTTRARLTVGDVFRLAMGDARDIRIEGACDRLDQVGQGMTGGTIAVDGDVGAQAGRWMGGGRLIVAGSTGAWAGSGMTGGHLEIKGSTGDRLGGPLAGEMSGMRGGIIVVRRDAGERAGDRMRRGTIIVEGGAGGYAGSRMLAGTLIVRGRVGPHPGYLMTRGTIVLGEGADALSPTFVDCGVHDLVAARLLASFVTPYSRQAARLFGRPMRRLAGDMAVLGKGETFIAVVR